MSVSLETNASNTFSLVASIAFSFSSSFFRFGVIGGRRC